MKKIKKYLRYYHVTEEGSVLLVALGIIVLLFVIITGIFFYALDTQKNILLADRYTTLKDAKSYALEESKTRLSKFLDEEMPTIINEVPNPSQDTGFTAKIKEKLNEISVVEQDGQIRTPFFSSDNFGADKQYRFEVAALSDNTIVETGAVYGHEASGGWSGVSSGGNQVAKKITIPITVELIETKDNNPITHSASSHLVYEVQWSEKSNTASPNGAPDPSKLDAWRNIFYNHYTNGENGLISADTWTRLLYRGYKYPGKTPESAKKNDYDSVTDSNVVFGGGSKWSLTNIKLTDNSNFLPDLTPKDLPNKSLVKNLESRASFILEDVGLINKVGERDIKAGNILAFTSKNQQEGAQFNNIFARANTGIFISRPKQVTTFDKCNLQTQSLLINQSRKDMNTGLVLKDTNIEIGKLSDRFNYSQYPKSSSLDNPQNHPRWSDMLKGGMVVAGSTVEVSKGKITLEENSNFMLTNATIKEDTKGEESFGYQTSHKPNNSSLEAVLPNPPSVLKITDGSTVDQSNTGLSFIDAPKKNRRQSSTENSSQAQGDWLDVEVGRNTIEIGDKSQLNLGITGIEPFVLKLAKGGIFSFYAPSDPSLLDTTFLEKGLKSGSIKGKVIIYESSGGFDVAKYLQRSRITQVSEKSDQKNAKDGEVTVIKNGSSIAKSRNILRTFSYMVDVDFKKTK